MNLKDAGIYDLTNIFKGSVTALHSNSQGAIINNKSRLINIPAYQRPYRWGKENIDKLFQDYEDNDGEYFLGSAVAVQNPSQTSEIQFDVIDGQQRITTLYLLNYVSYLLMRECYLEDLKNIYNPNSTQLCQELKDTYFNIIGKNSVPFDNLIKKLTELSKKKNITPQERLTQIINCYKEELCIADEKNTEEETINEIVSKLNKFFNNEQLCLKYTRRRYNEILKKSLCSVYLKHIENTNNFDLCIINSNQNDEFLNNYLNALKAIFRNIWDRAVKKAENSASIWDISSIAIELTKDMIKNMSLCVVITENENDANKLFEVLNDRALEVEDLELIKNHFYKEYCTKSTDTDDVKDSNITLLDELWTDKIFDPNTNSDQKRKLISYLTTIYLTKDKELSYKDDVKMKDAIKNNYSEVNYKNREYTYNDILSDFNTYFAIKILLDKFGFKTKRTNALCLKAEQSDKSISYKAFHLLNALNLHAVMPALMNVIISSYIHDGNALTDNNFELNFKTYVDELIEDRTNSQQKFYKIHKCSYMLWTSAIKAKNYDEPRKLAKRLIEKYGWNTYDTGNMDFESDEIRRLTSELNDWLDNWSYDSQKTFAVKIVLLNLLLSERDPHSLGFNQKEVNIKLNTALAYRLDADKLQLDHLEANKIDESCSNKYYKSNDREQRQIDVNGYLGNFMILDADDNNAKNNAPLEVAISYYSKTNNSWLIDDIRKMLSDNKYFDSVNHLPKEDFFKTRSIQLKSYFKAFLNRSFDQTEIVVKL